MKVVTRAAAGLWKDAELTVYDTAQRLGAYMGKEPEVVFLHRGTRVGARALGFAGSLLFILPSKLPGEFRKLNPSEIEDCLCIYANDFKRLNSTVGIG